MPQFKQQNKPKPWLPVEHALTQIMANVHCALPQETCLLQHAYGRVLSEDIHASVDVPHVDNSAMDGYALRVEDMHLKYLPISQRVTAGTVPVPLQPNTCARIFTGAHIPAGANVVIMQEDTLRHIGENAQISIEIIGEHRKGAYIRPKGQDIAQGDLVLPKNSWLSPRHMGVLASIGKHSIQVYRRLKVAVISTGSELQEPGLPLGEGKIYNSNRYQMAGLLQQMGMEFLDFGIVADDRKATQAMLSKASETADVIITSGGVSVGEEDHVKACVEALGSLAMWKLAIKPGKPLAFGHIKGVPFFGLPGNPASVLVTFMVIAKPYLLAMQGILPKQINMQQAILTNPPTQASMRQEYLRVRIIGQQNGLPLIQAMTNQNSGVLSTAMHADGLGVVPIGACVNTDDAQQQAKAQQVVFLPFHHVL